MSGKMARPTGAYPNPKQRVANEPCALRKWRTSVARTAGPKTGNENWTFGAGPDWIWWCTEQEHEVKNLRAVTKSKMGNAQIYEKNNEEHIRKSAQKLKHFFIINWMSLQLKITEVIVLPPSFNYWNKNLVHDSHSNLRNEKMN
jgi:hypothetical protein